MWLFSRRSRFLDHREAMRMNRKARHVPFGTLLLALLILACALSAFLDLSALGPANSPLR